MGARSMPKVATRLLDAGLMPDTPVAVIHAATLPDEEVSIGTLADAATGRLTARSPSVVVIGDVVAARQGWRG